jgi:putative drug exporter of the RND superfamily
MSTATAASVSPTERGDARSASSPSGPRPGPLGRLAGVAYRHRGRMVLAWLGVLVVAFALSATLGGKFTADYTAPGSDSKAAQQLLENRFPAQSGDTVDVVVQATGTVTAPAAKAAVTAVLAQIGASRHVAGVADPYTTPGSISPDGHTLVAHARLDVVNPIDMPVADSKHLLDLADQASTRGLKVSLGGQSIAQAEQGSIGSEGIGLAAAAVILLLMFGSVVAAGLPILVAVGGLAVSSALTGLVISFVDAPDWSTSLATMMGIGIGIDYALLMVTRFREWRAAGLDSERATIATLDTAGRSVLVAGTTVVISMLGLFAMGLSFMRGAAVVTIVSVLVVMVAAITLFPALLGYLGRHIERLHLPIGRRRVPAVAVGGHVEPSPRWMAWSRFVARRRIAAAAVGVALLLALAAPFLGVRFGFPDAGNNRAGTSTRQAYDTLATGFGPGANGPLLLAVELPAGASAASLDGLTAALRSTPGVQSVSPVTENQAGDTAVLSVVPTTGPQSSTTEKLVHRLRDNVIPAATRGTNLDVHVGGVTAASIDSTSNIAKRIPLLIAGVVLLSMILLLVSFRSVTVAAKAAVMNLLSVSAAYGVVALVLQGGWAGRLVGIDHESPLPAFVPVLMFAVLFGLSMDYEVFLVSRMRETWLRTGDNGRAIVEGLAGTGRVITAAAAIMVAVFAAFVPSPDLVLKVIGIGMASAIFIDATVVRMLLVPAVMHLLGRRNWWMPRSFERFVPQLHVEGNPEQYLPARPTQATQAAQAARTGQATVVIPAMSSSSLA